MVSEKYLVIRNFNTKGINSCMHLHFLANCRIFLKKKVNVDIKITSCYAPRHSTNNLKFTSTSYLDLLSTNTSCTESKATSLLGLSYIYHPHT